MKFYFVIALILQISSAEAKLCGKGIKNIKGSAAHGGKLYELSTKDDQYNVRVKDFRGKLIKEYKIPQNISKTNVSMSNGQAFYIKEGSLYHYDLENGVDTFLEKASGFSFCGSSTSDLYVSCQEGKKVLFHYKTKTKLLVNTEDEEINLKGNTLAYKEPGKMVLHDLESNRPQVFPISPKLYPQINSENHVSMVAEDEDEGINRLRIHFVKTPDGWKQIKDTTTRKLSGTLKSGELLFMNLRHKSGKPVKFSESAEKDFIITTDLMDPENQRKISTIQGAVFPAGEENSLFLHSLSSNSKPTIIDESAIKTFKTGNILKGIPANMQGVNVSNKENWVALKTEKGSEILNPKTGKRLAFPISDFYNMKESKDGKRLLIDSESGNYVLNVEDGAIKRFSNNGNIQFDYNFDLWVNSPSLGVEYLDEVCYQDSVLVKKDCNCGHGAKSPLISKDLVQLSLKTLCSAPGYADDEKWNELAPELSEGEISFEDAAIYLQKFQKINGFSSEIHLPILIGILKSDFVEENPTLVKRALQRLAQEQPHHLKNLYSMLKLEARLSKAKDKNDPGPLCHGEDETISIKTFLDEMKNHLANEDANSEINSWTIYRPYTEELKKLPAEEQEALINSIAESLSRGAAKDPALKGLFQSKLYYLAKKLALELFGKDSKPVATIALTQRNGNLLPVIMGSSNIDDGNVAHFENLLEHSRPYGFYFKSLPSVALSDKPQVGDILNKKFSWSQNGNNYSANAKVTVREPLSKLISKDTSPDYKALKKDGTLTGLMIIGTNLAEMSSSLVDNYITYYSNQDFEFEGPEQINVMDFLPKAIRSGEVDYLIKEAHSDGDENNLFRMDKHGLLFKGTLKKKDGTKEVIYLVGADPEKKDSKLISNQDFGEWIRARPAKNPLIYFNASCNSSMKVVAEVGAAHSPNFIPIPSNSAVLTFSDSDTNGTREI